MGFLKIYLVGLLISLQLQYNEVIHQDIACKCGGNAPSTDKYKGEIGDHFGLKSRLQMLLLAINKFNTVLWIVWSRKRRRGLSSQTDQCSQETKYFDVHLMVLLIFYHAKNELENMLLCYQHLIKFKIMLWIVNFCDLYSIQHLISGCSKKIAYLLNQP